MAKKNGKDAGGKRGWKLNSGLKDETVHAVLSIVFFILSALFVFAAVGKGGMAGDTLYRALSYLFGVGYYLLPALFFILGASYLRASRPDLALPHFIGSFLFLISGLGIIDIAEKDAGGVVGGLVSSPLMKLFDVYLSLVVLGGFLVISLLIIFDAKPSNEILFFWRRFFKGRDKATEEEEALTVVQEEEPEPQEPEQPMGAFGKLLGGGEAKKKEKEEEEILVSPRGRRELRQFANYTPPPLSIFEKDRGKPDVGDLKANANIIKRTLQNFG
ncbi:MAG: DNA translocase FtsK 4TM domain-containing protein, partial [bacterium]|nr:DNA translocase FtsK 4TM domain-containing protein [bacterium]